MTQSSGSLTLATSSISGGFGITKVGSGTLNLINNSASTFTGATNVNDGTLVLNKLTDTRAVSGTLNIGDSFGTTGSATVTLWGRSFNFFSQITTDITIKSDGVLNFATGMFR